MHLGRRRWVWFKAKPTNPRDEPFAPRVIAPANWTALQHQPVLVCQAAERSHGLPSCSPPLAVFPHCDFVDVDSSSDIVVRIRAETQNCPKFSLNDVSALGFAPTDPAETSKDCSAASSSPVHLIILSASGFFSARKIRCAGFAALCHCHLQ